MEPTYEDLDEDGLPVKSGGRPKWQYTGDAPMKDRLDELFRICGGRKYFGSKQEARLWRIIAKKMKNGIISPGWYQNCVDWAREKNKDRTVIVFYSVESLILNASKMKDWEAKNKVGQLEFVEAEEIDAAGQESEREY